MSPGEQDRCDTVFTYVPSSWHERSSCKLQAHDFTLTYQGLFWKRLGVSLYIEEEKSPSQTLAPAQSRGKRDDFTDYFQTIVKVSSWLCCIIVTTIPISFTQMHPWVWLNKRRRKNVFFMMSREHFAGYTAFNKIVLFLLQGLMLNYLWESLLVIGRWGLANVCVYPCFLQEPLLGDQKTPGRMKACVAFNTWYWHNGTSACKIMNQTQVLRINSN